MKACDPMTATVEDLQKAFPDLGLFNAEDIVAWRTDHRAFPPETTLVGDLGLDRELARRLVEFATGWANATEVTKEAMTETPNASYLFDDEPTANDGRKPGPTVSFTDHPASGPGTATLIGVAPPPPASTPSRSPEAAPKAQSDDFDRAAAALDEIFHDREVPTHPTPPPPAKLLSGDADEPAPSTVCAEAVSQPSNDEGLEEKPVFESMPEVATKRGEPETVEVAGGDGDRPTIASAVDEDQERAAREPATAKKKTARKLVPALLAVVLAANVGLGVGLFQTRRDERRALAPIAPMSAEVKSLHSGQATLEKELDKTKAALAETKARVDKHDQAITTTAHAVEKVAQDQKAAEEAAARDTSSIQQRLANIERNRRETTYSLSEVVKIIDAVQDPSNANAHSAAPPAPSAPTSAHGPSAHAPPTAHPAPATHSDRGHH